MGTREVLPVQCWGFRGIRSFEWAGLVSMSGGYCLQASRYFALYRQAPGFELDDPGEELPSLVAMD